MKMVFLYIVRADPEIHRDSEDTLDNTTTSKKQIGKQLQLEQVRDADNLEAS